MDTINIKSNLYNYEVEFIENLDTQISKFDNCCSFVIDKNVFNLYKRYFDFIESNNIFLIDAVENKKNIQTVLELVDFWRERNIKKNWKIICFGGGITQDITCFASNIYLRNIDWYFFPTTLLAMSDSCIGGKCGINYGDYKNQLGVFYPPKKIFICKEFLNTLSDLDYLNGWGEILKFSLTSNSKFYYQLKNENSFIPCDNIGKYIYKGLIVKKTIIEEDEFEGDLRRVLNYGHTFGHALEAYTHYGVPHGKGVIWGIDVANYISYKLNMLSREEYLDIKKLIKTSFIKDEIIINDKEMLFNDIKADKKVKNNKLYFALLSKISNLIIYPLEINNDLYTMFCDYLEETHDYYCN